MEKVTESFDGTRLYYIHKKNQNPHTLVFLHGIGANWTVWRDEIDFFDKRGYSIIAPDLRGHGISEWPQDEEKYNYHNFVHDINHLIKKENINEFSFIGHSLGGAIAITYCELHKEWPKTMILMDTAHRYPFRPKHELNISPYFTHILRYIANHHSLKVHLPHLNFKKLENFRAKHRYLFMLFYHTPLKCVFKCLDTIHEYSKKTRKNTEKMLHSLNIPVLIMTADNDKTIPATFSQELHKLIKNSQIRVINDTHHRLIIEKPEEVNRHIWFFLKSFNI